MSNSMIDCMAWCLRAYRNAMKQGRPVGVDVERATEAVLQEYATVRKQDEDSRRASATATAQAKAHEP